MVYISFNQATAIFGVLYAAVLFYYYRRLKVVWRREAERSRYGMVLFTILFLFSIGAFSYVYYIMKKQKALQRRAAELIQKQVNKPVIAHRENLTAKGLKIGSSLLLGFIAFHRIMRKT